METENKEKVELQGSLNEMIIPGTEDTISLPLLLNSADILLEDKIAVITNHIHAKLSNSIVLNESLLTQVDNMIQKQADYDQKINNLVRELSEKEDEIFKLTDDKDDLQKKLNNAVVQLEEERSDKKRLGEEMEKLRGQLSKSSLPTETNLSISSPESIAKEDAKRIPIINLKWDGSTLAQTHYFAELAETGETIRFHYFNKGLYREVTAEEAETFRKEAEQVASKNVIQDQPLVEYPTVPDFPFQSEESTDSVDSGEPAEDGTLVTREEFEALKADVANIKRVIGISAVA